MPSDNDLPPELEQRVALLLRELRALPWLKSVGVSSAGSTDAKVAADLAEAYDGYWDGWHGRSAAFWAAASRALEVDARRVLGDHGIDQIFKRVGAELGQVTWEALGEYLEHHRDEANVADAIAIDLHQDILRDAAWVVIEGVLGKPGVFTEALAWYRRGTRLFGWVDGLPPNGRPVVL